MYPYFFPCSRANLKAVMIEWWNGGKSSEIPKDGIAERQNGGKLLQILMKESQDGGTVRNPSKS